MQNPVSIAAAAAIASAAVGIANLAIVFGVLGAEVAADPARVAGLVLAQPAPLLWLEALKLVAAACTAALVLALRQLMPTAATRLAAGCGLAAALLLCLAGLAGGGALLRAISGAGGLPGALTYAGANQLVNGLGLAALFANGLWLLQLGWGARRAGLLPARLWALGLVLGAANALAFALPPLALLALILGIAWSLWLGVALRRMLARAARPAPAPHP